MTSNNHRLAQLFGDMAAMYAFLGPAERFRALAYAKASRILDNLGDDVAALTAKGALEAIPGIGESIAEKIREYLRTGTIRKLEALKKKVPYGLMELMQVAGFGPQSLRQIHDDLGISTREELVKAIEDGSLRKLKNFGDKKIENMKRGLKLHKLSRERMMLDAALALAETVTGELRKCPEVLRIGLAGSARRRKETVGDLDILVACRPKDRKAVVAHFLRMKGIRTVLARGDTRASILLSSGNRQVDLRVVNESEWGAALLYFTGSKEHNVHLRAMAKAKGWKINEYGIFRLKDIRRLAGRTEEEMYRAFGLPLIPPELRENTGEIERAGRGRLPVLVGTEDLRGDMHVHSTWSDGNQDLDALAQTVSSRYPYDYVVVTDHSRSERIAGGMQGKEFLRQWAEIDRVNASLGRSLLKKGVEVDILPDGSLDITDNILAQADWVCASVHSGFSADNTERLLRACRHPYVHCIGHPQGRLIGKREAYRADWKRLFRVAAETGTAMEINAQPQRLDLNDVLARQAHEAGVRLVIGTDSHGPGQFRYMDYGVAVARRAWCTARHILNTRPWREVQAFATEKRKNVTSMHQKRVAAPGTPPATRKKQPALRHPAG